jgi:hypothetical protein
MLLVPGSHHAAPQTPALPDLLVEPSDGADAARLRRLDTTRLRAIVRLVGLDEPGGAIRVVLAGESTELARRTPSWIAGFAHVATDTIVLFPARATQYPYDSLEEVLHHEVAHILVDRAAGGQPVPRWFSEGLATVAEGQWRREDRRQLALALTTGAPVRMQDVDRWFRQGPSEAARAYAVSAAFVRDLLDVYGREVAARLLAGVAAGESFDAALTRVTGARLSVREAEFDARMGSWERWVPLVTSPYVLWFAVTALALLAIWRRRQRSAAIRRRWADEDRDVPDWWERLDEEPEDLSRPPRER